jgi:DNA-nicking Smr family endonuclease
MYLSRLGGARRVPRLAIPTEQVKWLSLDHRTGFLLSLCDGKSPLDDILDVSGMPQLEALRLLFELLQQSVIQLT